MWGSSPIFKLEQRLVPEAACRGPCRSGIDLKCVLAFVVGELPVKWSRCIGIPLRIGFHFQHTKFLLVANPVNRILQPDRNLQLGMFFGGRIPVDLIQFSLADWLGHCKYACSFCHTTPFKSACGSPSYVISRKLAAEIWAPPANYRVPEPPGSPVPNIPAPLPFPSNREPRLFLQADYERRRRLQDIRGCLGSNSVPPEDV